jgi:hypothetical protein
MKDELFNELLKSVREGGAILCGEKAPSRTFGIEKPDAFLDVVQLENLQLAKKGQKERKRSE